MTLSNDTLAIATAGFEAPLEHYHYDIFQVPTGLEGRNAPLGGLRVAFLYDKKGVVDRVTIPLEPSVDDIVFQREVD